MPVLRSMFRAATAILAASAVAQPTPATLAGRLALPEGLDPAPLRITLLSGGAENARPISEPVPVDRDGVFTVVYRPPPADEPILLRVEFTDARAAGRVWLTAWEPGRGEVRLPDGSEPTDPGSAALAYSPADHGFRFVNSFEGSPLPKALEDLLGIRLDGFGLCGGMSFAAADLFLAGDAPPPDTAPPKAGTPLYRYLYRRQVDSLGAFGVEGLRFSRWMALPEDTLGGTMMRTWDQVRAARALLDAGRPAVLGLNYVARGGGEVWQNHQVLAIGYRADGERIELAIYDPNYPGRASAIRAERTVVGSIDDPANPGARIDVPGLKCSQTVADRSRARPVRGLFVMPYAPVDPPADVVPPPSPRGAGP